MHYQLAYLWKCSLYFDLHILTLFGSGYKVDDSMSWWKKKQYIYDTNRSATTFKPLTGEVNDIVTMQGNLGSWHWCGGHLDRHAPPNTVADQTHPLVATVLPDGCNEFKVSTWPPKSPDPNTIKSLWDVPEQLQSMEASPHDQQDWKDPPPASTEKPPEVLCPRLDGSGLMSGADTVWHKSFSRSGWSVYVTGLVTLK